MSFSERGVEIKFSTDSSGLLAAWNSELLAGAAPAAASQTLRSTYYDTSQGDLMRRGMTLRLRRMGRSAPTIAFTWSAPPERVSGLGEVITRHPNADLDIDLLGELVASEVRKAIGDRKLQPQFETRFKRRSRRVILGGSQFEAVFNEGEIVAGARRAPVMELELELRAGQHGDLYDFANQLAEELPLQLETLSEPTRGYLLSADARPYPVKAQEVRFAPGATFDDAAALVIGETLQHFLANWASLRDGSHPEAIHQMRVALRRMRALLALFHRETPCADFVAFRAEAKRIAGALGPARECDVFAGLVVQGPREQFGKPKLFSALDALIRERRDALHEEAGRLIAAPASVHFVLALQAFLARRGWRNALPAEELPRLTQPVREFAEKALHRLRKRALAKGKGLANLPDEQRHELRISLKNLRYAVEFFGGLFAEPRQLSEYLRPIARLQDLLGAHNDAVGARSFLDDLKAAERPDTAFAAGAMLGWFAGGAAVAQNDLMHAWRAFKGAEPFWS